MVRVREGRGQKKMVRVEEGGLGSKMMVRLRDRVMLSFKKMRDRVLIGWRGIENGGEVRRRWQGLGLHDDRGGQRVVRVR